jgi:hypothetical protein
MVARKAFVEEWAEKLEQGSGTLFAGAGVSMGAGYPSWRGLLAKIAEELGLDIDQEHDLAAVAQHFVNKSGGKGRLTNLIAKEFPRRPVPSVLRVVARLPLRHVWTTNWDELIETAFRENRREAQVMERTGDLTFERADADVVVYKMHGSVNHLDDVVFATDDFELYRLKREAFLRVLAAHLISTSFLFIGISFSDPNLSHLLAGIREMYMRYQPEAPGGKPHYAIVKRPLESEYKGKDNSEAKFKTASIRHELFVNDLKRYNIHCVEVDAHSEIETILSEVEERIARGSVFVSGSLPDGALDPAETSRIRGLGVEIGRVVAASGKRLVSGYGLGLGDHVLSGMLNAAWIANTSTLDRRITIRPFPQQLPPGTDADALKTRYREDLMAPTGTCIVIAGISATMSGAFETAPGVREEIAIAKKFGRLIVPIGISQGVAAELWQEMNADLNSLDKRVPRDAWAALGDPKANSSAIGAALANILAVV